MSKSNIIIVHGAYGHPVENWFNWMRIELEKLGIECLVPQLPTPNGQELKNWLQLFSSTISPIINHDTILIGHSLGAAFLLRWLEQANQTVSTTILVGSFIGNVGIQKFDKINKSFFTNPFDWHSIINKSKQFFCYHGSNDPYVSRSSFDFIAKNLHARKIIISNGGHLNEAAGYTSFPQLLIQLKSLLGIDYGKFI
ncbi:YdeN-like protein [Legionella gratiana]|uniref:YdeN-like protein n=1 Tax=Legionella gratiana TaxID=45066 RepID=A0A378JF71_9GAMM|nr:alpha/beta fold hydrolase [Legionella gratiana]KTD13415.1 YdeN-like protein [Legionella gratiana]STX46493.1 YdeN-like protein [Legionella gratiana]